MQLLRDGKYDDATDIYWQLHPARKVKAALCSRRCTGGPSSTGRPGSSRAGCRDTTAARSVKPTMRLQDNQMAALRKGLLDAGLEPSMDPFREFFIGRH